jgi:uncharacterized protein YbbC (DUF1343 family)
MMLFISSFKNTVLLSFLICAGCGNPAKSTKEKTANNSKTEAPVLIEPIMVAANRTAAYIPLLKNKKIAVVANQTSVIFNKEINTHLVDSLLALQIDIKKVFTPEHGFRGQADAGEKVTDGTDPKTGLPLISLHGKIRKPSQAQLEDIDVVLFDIQDVGVRFYTYIATLQLVMEACVEKGIPIIVLDRPNPNAHYVDGPTMKAEHTSFLGMTEIPLIYGMTIGEYAQMINQEGWLEGEKKAELTVIPLENWTRDMAYHLPIRPSPNLPNDTSISLYPSLGLFEGTNTNAGRGTEFQFQRYGASFMDSTKYDFSYVPKPNFGSKHPKEEGEICYGKEMSLKWLIDAYQNTADKSKFFLTSGFTKHAGTEKLQKQIEAGNSEAVIKATWQADIEKFNKIRLKYLSY